MKSLIILIFTIAALIFTNSCNSPTENQQQFKHPKDMVWTADTLLPDPDAIQLLPENLLVFAPNDIWLVCYSDVAKRLLWHYDGKTWTPIESGGGKRYKDLAGYNQHDIWLGGYSGEKAHFTHKDGNNFIRHDFDIKGQILDMTMDDKGNIWACGRNGIIMKYDKTKWIADTISVNHYSDSQYILQSITSYLNYKYVLGTNIDFNRRRNVYYFIKGDFKNWTIIDSIVINVSNSTLIWGDLKLFANKNGNLYSAGVMGLWEYQNYIWKHVISANAPLYDVYGVDEKYVLAVGDFLQFYFYDGSTWQDMKKLLNHNNSNVINISVWTDGKEIFISGILIDEIQKTIVWHGK